MARLCEKYPPGGREREQEMQLLYTRTQMPVIPTTSPIMKASAMMQAVTSLIRAFLLVLSFTLAWQPQRTETSTLSLLIELLVTLANNESSSNGEGLRDTEPYLAVDMFLLAGSGGERRGEVGLGTLTVGRHFLHSLFCPPIQVQIDCCGETRWVASRKSLSD